MVFDGQFRAAARGRGPVEATFAQWLGTRTYWLGLFH